MIDSWYQHSHHFLNPSSSDSTSSRSSHLSILTSTSISSALSDAPQPPSPLSPSPSQTSGSKTNAFFGSPFSADLELQPPPPISRSPSLASSKSVSTSLKEKEVERSDADSTPRLPSSPPPPSVRSLNDSFFSASSINSYPTPPPAIRPTPRTNTPPTPEISPPAYSPPTSARARLAPLSRLFPSRVRYTDVDAFPSRESSLRGHSLPNPYSLDPSTTGRRAFVELGSEEYRRDESDVVRAPGGAESTSAQRQGGSSSQSEARTQQICASLIAKGNHKQLSVRIPAADTGASSLPTPIAISSQVTPPPATPAPAPKPGDVIEEPRTGGIERVEHGEGILKLQLVRTLGQGAFSSVWLAQDISGGVGRLEVVRKTSLKRSRSLQRQKSSSRQGSLKRKSGGHGSLRRKIDGALPKVQLDERMRGTERVGSGDSISMRFRENSESASETREEQQAKAKEGGRLVALKMTDRSLCDKDDRTRVSFVREVEVLKHISHPSIVSYIHALSTPSHHLLVLEHVSGGELFDLVSSPEIHAQLTEPILRRIFGELCRAVGWMHAVGLVHRDIKLENILLTRSSFTSAPSSAPLVKLSDFGLSRFIDPEAPYLTTRCGSESYACPELVTGRPYDGRESDAWACGVVLYALVTRRLPFDAWDPAAHEEGPKHEERYAQAQAQSRAQADAAKVGRVRGPRRDERSERRALLMRIAKGEYSWPDAGVSLAGHEQGQPLRGTALAESEGVRRIVGKLLVRDPKKRARVTQLWEDEWMRGEGAPQAPTLLEAAGPVTSEPTDMPMSRESEELEVDAWEEAVDEEAEWGEEVEDEGEGDGVLVDEQDIGPGSVARQEH